MKIIAVTVTYKRPDMLKKLLTALKEQTRQLDDIIVIDNNENNIGCSAGFNQGIQEAYERGADWIWCLDDDAIPENDTLEKMSKWCDRQPGFISCPIYFKNTNIIHKNNDVIPVKLSEFNWLQLYKIIAVNRSMWALLINRFAIKSIGLPIKEMFLSGDDNEYTKRISDMFRCFMICNTRINHYTKENIGRSQRKIKGDATRKYHYRNFVYNTRHEYSWFDAGFYITRYFIKSVQKCFKEKQVIHICTVVKWFVKGLFFNPGIEYV
jgi:GT2 family glycosyltransferase